MAKVFDFTGDNNVFHPAGFLYQNPKEPNLFLSPGNQIDVYFPHKKSRVGTPFVVRRVRKLPTIEVLPDECLFEVFRRLPGQERSACACVSKRWLMLTSTIQRDEICSTQFVESKIKSDTPMEDIRSVKKGEFDDLNEMNSENEELQSRGYLSRCLEGKKATDVRLAAISVGTASRGGLGKLTIRGNSSTSKLSNLGLKAISRGCPSLGVLSLWNVSSIGDDGLSEIASGCPSLEKLVLSRCPAITDKGLTAIAMKCPNLTSVSIESCSNIGDESLQALGRNCRNCKYITVRNCPLVSDRGIVSLFSSAGDVITKTSLESLNISDVSLAVIGHYGSAMTDLALNGLNRVNEKGFWVMGKGQGLQKLKSLAITSCKGVTDAFLDALGKGCPNLKQFLLRKCLLVSDSGVASFAKDSQLLESLKLEECHGFTQSGVYGLLANARKLKMLALVNCFGIRNTDSGLQPAAICDSLRSLTISNCPGIGDTILSTIARFCPNLTNVNLVGLPGITDSGILPLVQGSDPRLAKVNLNGCVNLSDNVVIEIAKLHGETLEILNLDGCGYITDLSLMAIAENCLILSELDVSKCGITDSGIGFLAGATRLNLQILSIAGCTSVSDRSLGFLGALGKTLVGLNIQKCCFGYDAVNMLLENLWRCDILY